MGNECPDRYVVVVVADLVQARHPSDVHHRLGREQPQLHHGDEAHAAGHHLGELGVCQGRHRFLEAGGSDVIEAPGVHQLSLLASWIACHTRFGRNGMSMWVTPSGRRASTTALTIVWAEAIVPASPIPFTPSGLMSVGVTVRASSKRGRSEAVGSG